MDSSVVINKIYKLPDHLVSQVNKFVDTLLTEEESKDVNDVHPKPVNSGYGAMKGMFIIREDFDEPLEDFKEYM